MPLKLDKKNNSLFSHNRDFSEGINERTIRQGLGMLIVAQDGSGDAETIQEGLNMLPSDGGIVYVKEGIYEITNTIILKNNQYLKGSGYKTIIYQNTATPVRFIENDNLVNGDENIRVENIALQLDGTTTNEITGLYLYLCRYAKINNIYVVDGVNGKISPSIHLKGCNDSKIYNNHFEGTYNGGDGTIFLETTIKSIVESNIFSSQNSPCIGGIKLNQYSNQNIIANNIIHENGGSIGISIDGDYNIVTGNRMTGCSSAVGITILSNADRTIVSNNISYGNTGGNYNDAGTNTTATGNIFA